MNIICPQCNSKDHVTRASAMYYDCLALADVKDYPPTSREIWTRRQLLPADSKIRKALAKRLAPPRKPDDGSGGAAYAAVEAGGLFAEAGPIGIIVGFFAIILLPFAIFYSLNDARVSYSHAAWQEAMDKWDTALYCAHCDGVFMTGQDKIVPSKQMAKLLYSLLPACYKASLSLTKPLPLG